MSKRPAHHGGAGPEYSPAGSHTIVNTVGSLRPADFVSDARGGWGPELSPPASTTTVQKRPRGDPAATSSSSSSTVARALFHESSPPPPPPAPPSPSIEQVGEGEPISFRQVFRQQALEGVVQDIKMRAVLHPIKSLERFLKAMRKELKPMIEAQINEHTKGIKFWVSVHIRYSHPLRAIDPHMDDPYLHTGSLVLMHPSALEERLDEVERQILIRNANYIRDSSGLVVEDIFDFRLKFCKYNPLVGRAYQELPKFLKNKHAIINVQNRDNRCFGYALLSALENNEDHPYRPQNYEALFAKYHLDQIQYPVEIEQIADIEDQLQLNINVFSFFDDEGRARYPMLVSEKQYNKCIDLLYWDAHYAYIHSFSAFMADLSKKHTLHWCKACLGHFDNGESLKTHKLWCRGMEDSGQIFITPEPWWKVSFSNKAYVHLHHSLPFSLLILIFSSFLNI